MLQRIDTKTEESKHDNCTICYNEMVEEDITTKLNCNHKFHTNCINDWIQNQKKKNLDRKCPNCNTKIQREEEDKIQKIIKTQEMNRKQNDKIKEFTNNNFTKVVENQTGTPGGYPFLGVIVLYRNGKNELIHLKTYLNTDLELNLNSNISNLKNAILTRPNELALQCRWESHAFVAYLIRRASFVIEKMYFGTPNRLNYIQDNSSYNKPSIMAYDNEDSNRIQNLNNDEYNQFTLKDIYKLYSSKAKNILSQNNNPNYELEDVFNTHIRGLQEQVYTNYFYNHNNPVIPEEFRPASNYGANETILEKSTKNPLAWMIVEVGCDTFRRSGGKTRRNKLRRNKLQRKRNKSQRRNRSVH